MRNVKRDTNNFILALVAAPLFFTGCTKSDTLFGTVDPGATSKSDLSADADAFVGCVDAVALDYTQIRVSYQIPATAEKFTIFRDGVATYTTTSTGSGTWKDTGLREGQLYTYTCEAVFQGTAKLGTGKPAARTASFNAPKFGGIVKVEPSAGSVAPAATSRTIFWDPELPTGVAADYYLVYAQMDSPTKPGTVTWTEASLPRVRLPRGTITARRGVYEIEPGQFELTITNLGDEIPYVFAVRACSTASGVERCDSNLKVCNAAGTCSTLSSDIVAAGTLPDTGAPQTPGTQTLFQPIPLVPLPRAYVDPIDSQMKVELYAPWDDTMGGVKRRLVYQMEGVCSTDINLYEQVVAREVQDITDVPNRIVVPNIEEAKSYCFIVRDQDTTSDPVLSVSQNTNYVALATADMTPPNFSGATFALGPDKEKTVRITFPTVAREGSADIGANKGAFKYVIYGSEAAHGTTLSATCDAPAAFVDACKCLDTRLGDGTNAIRTYATIGDPITGLAAMPEYAPGQTVTYDLTGLNPRTKYNFCMKALDKRPNTSTNEDSGTLTTIDTTSPNWLPATAFSAFTFDTTLKLTLAPIVDTNPHGYRIQLWKVTGGQACTTPPADYGITPSYIYKEMATLVTVGANKLASIGANFFPYADNDRICAIAEACDDGEILPDGQKNCSKDRFATEADFYAAAREALIDEAVAPAGFRGVLNVVSTAEGTATVNWWWPPENNVSAVFGGFKIFVFKSNTVFGDDAKIAATDYSQSITGDPNTPYAFHDCGGPCSDFDSSETVGGLDPGRTYKFFVMAYDATPAKLETTYLNRDEDIVLKRISDTTPPTFNSGLSGTIATQAFDFTTASDDNQAEGKLRYEVYRKADTTYTFTDPGSPPASVPAPAGGKLLQTLTSANKNAILSFADPEAGTSKFRQGEDYFYTVCALDASGNRTCDGATVKYREPDLIPPVVSLPKVNKQHHQKKFSLEFRLDDNAALPSEMTVRVFRKFTTTGPEAFTKEDPAAAEITADATLTANDAAAVGTRNAVFAGDALQPGVRAAPGQNGWHNYAVYAYADGQESAPAVVSVKYDNRLTVSRVQRNFTFPTSESDAKRWVVVYGQGFSRATENGYTTGTTVSLVTAGGSWVADCANPSVIDERHLSCTMPNLNTEGVYYVNVANPDGSVYDIIPATATAESPAISFAYLHKATYLAGGLAPAYPALPCDTGLNTGFVVGRGTSADNAYIVCTGAQLKQLSTYNTAAMYIKLGTHIDLSDPANTWTAPATDQITNIFNANLDGDFYTIRRLTQSRVSYAGLFSTIQAARISNLGLVDFNVRATSTSTTGRAAFLTPTMSGTAVLDHVYASGTLQAGSPSPSGAETAGLVALAQVAGVTIRDSSASGTVAGGGGTYNATTVCTRGAGGLVGMSPGLTIQNSFTDMDFTSSGYCVGGLVGRLYGPSTITDSFSTGNITAYAQVGGLLGLADSTTAIRVERSFASGQLSASIYEVGGLIGTARNKIEVIDSHSSGVITATAGNACGGLVGVAIETVASSPLISTSHSAAKMNCPQSNAAGGLVGKVDLDSTGVYINDSFSTGDISGNIAGGIVGIFTNSAAAPSTDLWLDSVRSYGIVTPTNNGNTGGIAGQMARGSIRRSAALGFVVGNGVDGCNIGGLVGTYNEGRMEQSYATAPVVCTQNGFAGGLVGSASNLTVDRCYYSGSVTVPAGNLAGLIAFIYGTTSINDSYSQGTVTGINAVTLADEYWPTSIAGFVGGVGGSLQVDRSYSASVVTGVQVPRGHGFVALDNSSWGLAVNASYYDSSLTPASAYGTAKATADLQPADDVDAATKLPTWLPAIWQFEPGKYPTLKNMPNY